MKDKIEIEQLAERYADGYSTEEAHASYIAFQDGYTQCQEDMVDKPKQETLEEAAEKYINTKNPQWTPYHRKSFEDGAKWQQTNSDKKYTEEDLMSAFNAGINNDYGNGPSFDKWLNSLNKQD